VLAETQDEYENLPVYRDDNEMISCWRLSRWEAIKLLFTRRLWLRQLTFRSALQPQLPQVENPWR